ncbi:MAG: long-chain fatty acid--CoA ligase [Bacteroidales bacterium]|nr:long-chain fatty acid--CoA ligase [Bacteroidales bacterium]MCF8388757.1 long-chain fatty acid--CoA ligase [Bacteroidales bacterium]
MEVNRLFDLLPRYKETFRAKDDAVAGKENGEWVKYDINSFIEIANNISYGLLGLGVKKGDKIATISPNRPEWNFLDFGILQTGAIHVPIYPTISESDYQYILNHAEVQYVFVAGKELLTKIEHILPDVPSLKGVYTFKHIDEITHLQELIDLGKENPQLEKLEEIKAGIQEDDIATLIYTSGTMGNPKGVLLSHKNILSNVKILYPIFPVDESCTALSYLPMCHVYERTNFYIYLYLGLSVYYAENMGKIADNIREVQPDILTTVPRLLEKVYDKIIAKGRKLKGIRRHVFFWAVNLGKKYDVKGKSRVYKSQLAIANKLVFHKWREALGGRMRVIVSGGAALQTRLGKIFTAAQIPILEGYGLTETSPVIAVSTFEKNGRKFGTVGPVLKNLVVKIADDGEICVKGPSVFVGYYKQEDMTKEAIDEKSFFHTGDLGQLEPGGQLKITGRKKEIFKTSLGKYISPALLENKFKESPFIDSILVVGENQKYAAALVVPDFDHLRTYCDIKGIEYKSDAEIVEMPEIKKRFQREIDEYNQYFGKTEQLMRFKIMATTWSVENGELTASLKLRRNHITEKYASEIEKLFK